MTRSYTSRTSSIILHTPDAGPRRPDAATGQHAAWHPAPWHHRLLVALIAGGVLAGLTVAGVRMWEVTPACAPVRIVAAPEIASLVATIARRLDDEDGCAFSIVPGASTDEATAPGLPNNGTDPPRVWIPESSLLLAQARARGAAMVPATGTSVVSSPVVMALGAEAVGKLEPARPTCDAVLRSDQVVVGAPDPAHDPVGLATLLEARADLGWGPDGDATLMAFLRKLQQHVGAPGEDLSDQLPGASAKPPVTAFATTEQQMLRHNADHPDAMLTAAYPDEAPTWMDYPFTVLASANPAERDAAARLLVALQEPNGQAALAAGGFRTPQGQAPAGRSADGRTVRDLAAPRPLAESATTDAALQRWATATRSGRVEVLIDVSGSMNAIVPALGKTRLAVTIDAAARGLNLFEPTTTVGLWTFAKGLDGDRDYRQIVPITPVPQVLSGPALETLKSIRAIRGRQTGLYDSVLGLFEEARQNWEPDRLNVVLVLTDGNNDDPAGISRGELLRRLAAESDPARPVRVIGVAVGPGANPTPLQEIAHATGARSFVVNDPARIDKVLSAALGGLSKG
ncbi:MAG: substrate-binding domain-containing protein [Pseudonocardia sp.]|nr:substrate-binding domain-containing protein [Pseudonocardia sp.]